MGKCSSYTPFSYFAAASIKGGRHDNILNAGFAEPGIAEHAFGKLLIGGADPKPLLD